METLFTTLVGFVEASRYGLLFFTTLLGSPIVMIGAGYLIHIHQLDFWPAYGTIVAADLVGDVGWYWAGRRGARPFLLRYGHYFGITGDLIDRLEARFLRYHEWILIISKLTMGLGVAIGVLAVAGMMRVPFWRYMVLNVSGELLWALIPIAIGFYFGNVSDFLPPSLRLAFVVIALVAVVIVMQHVLKKLAAKEW
ncbi:MAG TPA: DedA family protein [Candidatus Paceibacterota bacterium]|nr:DedA family protein [Candidatus Paceibacterota bacterium]